MATKSTNVSIDEALHALVATRPGFPGWAAIMDTGLRQWAREQGLEVPPREPEIPLTERARLARQERANKSPKVT